MEAAVEQKTRWIWAALNCVGLLLVVLYGGGFTLLVVLLGTDRSETYVDEYSALWVAGAVLGLVVGLIAGRYDRRYLPWIAAWMLVGVMVGSLANLASEGGTLWLLGPLLAVSAVLHARTGPARQPREPRDEPGKRRPWTAVIVSGSVLIVVGALALSVIVRSQPTALYEAMRTDPMASEGLPGMTVRFDHSRDQTTPFGMPSAARVYRTWDVSDGSPREAKIDELATLAVGSGWTVGPDPVFCGWQKVVAGESLCLVIRPGADSGQVLIEITEDGQVG